MQTKQRAKKCYQIAKKNIRQTFLSLFLYYCQKTSGREQKM